MLAQHRSSAYAATWPLWHAANFGMKIASARAPTRFLTGTTSEITEGERYETIVKDLATGGTG